MQSDKISSVTVEQPVIVRPSCDADIEPMLEIYRWHIRHGIEEGINDTSRAKARRRISDALSAARKAKNGGRLAGQLELLLARVEELRDGALTPPSQQPLVRAMLLPIGSFGGTALLEYLLLPGLS